MEPKFAIALTIGALLPALFGLAIAAVELTAASRAVRAGDRTGGTRLTAAGLTLGLAVGVAPWASAAAIAIALQVRDLPKTAHPVREEAVLYGALAGMVAVRMGAYLVIGAGSTR